METTTHNNRGPFAVNNECNATHRNQGNGITYRCGLYKDHIGDHRSLSKHGEVMQRWFNNSEPAYANYSHVVDEEVAAIKKQTTVLLTLEDLKTIAYYMAEEEDGDKTKIKIDEALKGML